jgi:hypothetical protein
MANDMDIRPSEIRGWFRYFVLVTAALIALTIFIVGIWVPAPAGHPLLGKPVGAALEAVKFEVGYFTFLASLTGGVVAAMLAFLQLDRAPGVWRTTTLVSVFAFVIALTLVTLGYAMRNLWVLSNTPLDPRLVSIDAFADGPITAIMYIVGLLAMLTSVWDRYSS